MIARQCFKPPMPTAGGGSLAQRKKLVVVDQRRAHRKRGFSYDCRGCGVVLVYAFWSISGAFSGCPRHPLQTQWLPRALNLCPYHTKRNKTVEEATEQKSDWL